MAKVKFADDTEIKKLEPELLELQKVLQQSPSLFISDLAPFWYHGQSSQANIDHSAFNFYLTRLTLAYGMDFSPILSLDKHPKIVDLLKFIKTNRPTSSILPQLPGHLKYWGGIVNITNDLDPSPEGEVFLTGIISVKEQLDYQKGYAQTDPEFAKTSWLQEYDYFLKPGKYTMHFDDGTTKQFVTQEDIYYFLIASCSNNPKFRYDLKKDLN